MLKVQFWLASHFILLQISLFELSRMLIGQALLTIVGLLPVHVCLQGLILLLGPLRNSLLFPIQVVRQSIGPWLPLLLNSNGSAISITNWVQLILHCSCIMTIYKLFICQRILFFTFVSGTLKQTTISCASFNNMDSFIFDMSLLLTSLQICSPKVYLGHASLSCCPSCSFILLCLG